MIRDPLASRELLGYRGVKGLRVSLDRLVRKEQPDRLVRGATKDLLV